MVTRLGREVVRISNIVLPRCQGDLPPGSVREPLAAHGRQFLELCLDSDALIAMSGHQRKEVNGKFLIRNEEIHWVL